MEIDEQAVSARQIDLRDEIEEIFKKATGEKARLYANITRNLDSESLSHEFVDGFYQSFIALYEMTSLAFESKRREEQGLKDLMTEIENSFSNIMSNKIEAVDETVINNTFRLYGLYKPYIIEKNLLKIG